MQAGTTALRLPRPLASIEAPIVPVPFEVLDVVRELARKCVKQPPDAVWAIREVIGYHFKWVIRPVRPEVKHDVVATSPDRHHTESVHLSGKFQHLFLSFWEWRSGSRNVADKGVLVGEKWPQ